MGAGTRPADHYPADLSPLPQDVIAKVLAFHARRTELQPAAPPAGYRPESLNILFGTDR